MAKMFSMRDVVKTFPGVRAVDGVDFSCAGGEIRGLVGENGAGKSTLMGVLSGLYSPDSGELVVQGEPVNLSNYQDAVRAGITLVHQETSLIHEMTVCENLFLEDPHRRGGVLRWDSMADHAEEALRRLELDVDVWEKVRALSVAQRQKLEIAKALLKDPRVLILDEPTAPLPPEEVKKLFELLRELRESGVAIVFISHKLEEVRAIASNITVMKDGRVVETLSREEADRDRIIRGMVGRDLGEMFPGRPDRGTEETSSTLLEVSQLRLPDWEQEVSLRLRGGEILGIGGLQGQGQHDLLRALFGLVADSRGRVEEGVLSSFPRHPADAREQGLALIPSDRQEEGLMLIRSVRENLSLPTLDDRQEGGVIVRDLEDRAIGEIIDELEIKLSSPAQRVMFLSGGNQQKVVIGKWLIADPRILLMIEPTRGVDVATKRQIYFLLRRLTDRGISVVFTTTDMRELVGLCDRTLTMYQGGFTAEFEGAEITEENIVEASIPE